MKRGIGRSSWGRSALDWRGYGESAVSASRGWAHLDTGRPGPSTVPRMPRPRFDRRSRAPATTSSRAIPGGPARRGMLKNQDRPTLSRAGGNKVGGLGGGRCGPNDRGIARCEPLHRRDFATNGCSRAAERFALARATAWRPGTHPRMSDPRSRELCAGRFVCLVRVAHAEPNLSQQAEISRTLGPTDLEVGRVGREAATRPQESRAKPHSSFTPGMTPF